MKLKSDEYLTIKGEAHSRLTEKRSRFFGWASPIKSSGDIEDFLSKVRKQHHNPTHVVYAYRLQEDNGIREYCTDDGEPAHSAGQPVLKVLQGQNLENIICAVIRYFGGVKLGVGGLIRAYSETAKLVLANAKIIKKIEEGEISIKVKYSAIGMVIKVADDFNGTVKNIEYGAETVQVFVILRCSQMSSFREKLGNVIPFHLIEKINESKI